MNYMLHRRKRIWQIRFKKKKEKKRATVWIHKSQSKKTDWKRIFALLDIDIFIFVIDMTQNYWWCENDVEANSISLRDRYKWKCDIFWNMGDKNSCVKPNGETNSIEIKWAKVNCIFYIIIRKNFCFIEVSF